MSGTRGIVRDLVLVVILGIGFYFLDYTTADNLREAARVQAAAQRDLVISACQRSNQSRAAELIDGKGDGDVPFSFVKAVYPLLDCRATVDTNVSVSLDNKTSSKYVKLIRHRRSPILTNGEITGDVPLELPQLPRPEGE